MNRRLFGAFGVLTIVAFTAGGCKSDPLSDLDGNPARVVTDFSYLQLPIGSSQVIESQVLDARTTPLEVPVTFTACTNAVTVVADTSYHPVPPTSSRAIVTAATPANSCVVASGGGVSDTIAVSTVPIAFDGAVSTTSPIIGDTLILTSSALLGFDPASADIDFGDGIHGLVVRATADSLVVIVPQPEAAQPAVVTIEGVVVKYVPGLIVSMSSAAPLDVQPIGDRESGDVIITPPASGAPDLVFYDGFVAGADGASTFIDYLYQFTLAATDTLQFELSWDGGADLDMAVLRSNFTIIGGLGAATGANPERYAPPGVILPAGTYYLLIESFDDHDDPAHLFKVVIHNP